MIAWHFFWFLLFLSGFICVHQSLSVFICGFALPHKKIAACAPSQGVELGWTRPPRCMAAQPGGMSADILLAHCIAAAKVRRQSP
jgi:hypothetical protein